MAGHGTAGFGNASVPEVVARSIFQTLDANQDGSLDEHELQKLMEETLGMEANKERAQAALLLMDIDGDGTVCQKEFSAWLRTKEGVAVLTEDSKYSILCEAVRMFKEYDTDGSLNLSKEELERLLIDKNMLGDGVTVESAFEGIDRDGNSVISFQEFLRWLQWLPTITFASPDRSPR